MGLVGRVCSFNERKRLSRSRPINIKRNLCNWVFTLMLYINVMQDNLFNQISAASPRHNVQIRLPDGRAFNAPPDTPICHFMESAFPDDWQRITAALVNGKLRELSLPIRADCAVVPVSSAEPDGARIYRRSVSFLLIAAARDLFPNVTIEVQHSMPFGGYYCERADGQQFSAEQLHQLKSKMEAMVAANLPITQVRLPLQEALTLFRASGDEEKATLFAKRRNDDLTLYELDGVRDYLHGFMLPSTGYLHTFGILPFANGFALHLPRRSAPATLRPASENQHLISVFTEYARWLNMIGVPNVTALNQSIQSGRLKEVVLIAEALHQRQLAHIADRIAQRRDRLKVVLISGPTSAGKTTFSKRLAVHLLTHGIHPVAVGLDNYFVNRVDTPRDATGDYDFEHLEAVDVPLFIEQLQLLMTGQTITQPIYNFLTGEREWGGKLTLRPDQMLIIEGIHGLNPRLGEGLPDESIFRIYINAFTQLNLDKHNRIGTRDTRLLRRMVREYHHRGYSAADTIRRWPKVRMGEKRWIETHMGRADVFFNSALAYELAALKPLAESILLQVAPDTPERIEANRLRAFLQWFDPISAEMRTTIPRVSLLREFVGGSILEDFEPWSE